MALVATRADYEPANAGEGAAALYYNPATGQGYRQYPFFQERIDSLKGRFAPNGQKLLVAGCGWGYLVQLAVAAGYDAWGVDASAYAVGKAQAAIGAALAPRILQADVLNATQLRQAANAAGIPGGNPRFALLVTEDVLPCLTDGEITTAVTNLRARCTSNLLHICTLADPSVVQDSRCNWKTGAQWKALLSPPDLVVDENLRVL